MSWFCNLLTTIRKGHQNSLMINIKLFFQPRTLTVTVAKIAKIRQFCHPYLVEKWQVKHQWHNSAIGQLMFDQMAIMTMTPTPLPLPFFPSICLFYTAIVAALKYNLLISCFIVTFFRFPQSKESVPITVLVADSWRSPEVRVERQDEVWVCRVQEQVCHVSSCLRQPAQG